MSSELSSDVPQQEALERRRVARSSTNLSLVDDRIASAEVRALFAQYRERFARADLPGIVLFFATNPALLKGMMQIAEGLLFGDSLLSRRHKEMITTFGQGWSIQRESGGALPTLDFAGGTVVHITSGVSALVCALYLGKRLGYVAGGSACESNTPSPVKDDRRF